MKPSSLVLALLVTVAAVVGLVGRGGASAGRTPAASAPTPAAKGREAGPTGLLAQADPQPDAPAVVKKDPPPEATLYVAPTGEANAPGTKAAPLSLAGVCAKKDVAPGTHIHLTGGTYRMDRRLEIRWKGEKDRRVVLRSAPGEWAVLDGRLDVTGGAQYVTLRDFEITRTQDANVKDPNWWKLPVRQRPSYSGKGGLEFEMGGQLIILYDSEAIHLVNLYAHDNISGGGFGLWNPAKNTLIYGNLLIRNGWDDRGRGHGHGCYIQNGWPEDRYGNSVKTFRHNISAYNHSTGMKSYGSAPCIKGTHFFENVYYGNGMLAWTNGSANYLAGSGKNYMDDIILKGNVFYQPDKTTGDVGGTVYLGWGNKQKRTCVFTDNQVYGGGGEAVRAQFWEKLTFTGNTIYDDKRLVTVLDHDGRMKNWTWDNNTYHLPAVEKPIRGPQGGLTPQAWTQQTGFDANSRWIARPPTGVQVVLMPNQYDPDRAHIALMNWDQEPSVALDLSAFLKKGDRFVIYDALDYRGKPAGQGIHDGGTVKVALRESPCGREFYALVLHRLPARPDPE